MRATQRWTGLTLAVAAVALLAVYWLRKPPSSKVGERIPELRRMVEEEEQKSAEVSKNYAPKTAGDITDLEAPPADILRQLPGVAEVEVLVAVNGSTNRIIHLRDWHYVPKDLFAIDLRSAARKHFSDAEVDALAQELLLEVGLVQCEQMTLLRCLSWHHGLKRIGTEGWSPKDRQAYQAKIDALREIEKQMPELRQQQAKVRELMRSMTETDRQKTERYDNAAGIDREIASMLDQHRQSLLQIGAAGRLLVAGEVEEVFPLEDADLLDQAKPVGPGGTVKFDPAKGRARGDAIVRNALASGPVAFIVLGGAHDLSENVKRLTNGGCEYIRVTTRRYREFGPDDGK